MAADWSYSSVTKRLLPSDTFRTYAFEQSIVPRTIAPCSSTPPPDAVPATSATAAVVTVASFCAASDGGSVPGPGMVGVAVRKAEIVTAALMGVRVCEDVAVGVDAEAL